MIYVKDTITSRLLTTFPGQGLFVELNFRQVANIWDKYPPQSEKYYFNHLDIVLDKYSNYKNILMIGDFYSEIYDAEMCSFLMR